MKSKQQLTTEEPAAKKMKRPGSVEPLDRPMSESPLPDLPADLQEKQVRFVVRYKHK